MQRPPHVSGGIGSGENVIAFAGSRANAVLLDNGTLDTMPVLAFICGVSQPRVATVPRDRDRRDIAAASFTVP